MTGHIRALEDVQLTTPSIVSIGMFDGVHLGHQRLIRRLVKEARESGRTSVVLTFFPHPDVVIKGVTGRYYLTSPDERAQLLLRAGVDVVITHQFNERVRHIRAADFVDQLREHLKMVALWVGPNFALGYKREGDVDFLKAQGVDKGFMVETVDLMMGRNPGEVISSSLIREALQAGKVEVAGDMLGRPYRVNGEVVHGDHRGRAIGFPTANMDVWAERMLPANGVYACWAWLGDERHMAVTNIGVRPTFAGNQLMAEAHLLDFDRDIYGQMLAVDFVRRLREEKRFGGVQELVAQIRRDAEQGRAILADLAGPG